MNCAQETGAGLEGGGGPVVVLGMHRSGTTLIAQVLSSLGVHMGWRREANEEALFFLDLNNWLFRQSGGAWDRPEPVRDLLRHEIIRGLCLDYLHCYLKGPRSFSYWGDFSSLFGHQFSRTTAWGWKDPRNTFTLPIWKEIFPECRVIVVTRHGVDVAQSLTQRMGKRLEAGKRLHARRRGLYRFIKKKGGFTHSARCGTLRGSFDLWVEYCQMAREVKENLGSPFLEIRYEDFLLNPVVNLKVLAEFCHVPLPSGSLRILDRVNPDRAFAYRGKPELVKFANSVDKQLSMYGYEA